MQHMTPEEIATIRQQGLDLIAERKQIIREQETLLAEARRFNHRHDIEMAESEIEFRQEEIADISAKLVELDEMEAHS